MSYFGFYLLTVMFKIHFVISLIAVLLLMAFTVLGIIYLLEENGETLKKSLKLIGIAALVFTLMSILLPSKEDAKLIIAAGTVAKVVENKDVQRITDKSLAAIEAWLENVEKKDSK